MEDEEDIKTKQESSRDMMRSTKIQDPHKDNMPKELTQLTYERRGKDSLQL